MPARRQTHEPNRRCAKAKRGCQRSGQNTPNQTKPNQTKPNQTKPNQTKPQPAPRPRRRPLNLHIG
ncbi:hypothetical protein C2L66_35445 [Paraburkholderia caribensis]|nr:hypothetical protein C2L66_35445 [Paraburkholderia caribensis]